ncbi:MAG: hypothetical protein RL329_2466 [Bacteroidota bacterium]|jgi:hypothetical protein
MKTILFTALCAVLSFTSCQKQDVSPNIEISASTNVQLPAAAEQWLVIHYADYTIVKTVLVNTPEEKFYRVSINRNTPADDKTVVFDDYGTYLRSF